jgi:hypothetical protein
MHINVTLSADRPKRRHQPGRRQHSTWQEIAIALRLSVTFDESPWKDEGSNDNASRVFDAVSLA